MRLAIVYGGFNAVRNQWSLWNLEDEIVDQQQAIQLHEHRLAASKALLTQKQQLLKQLAERR